ncbi:MAG: hypothetical protein KC620_12325 [Myxococcales bacterium]|nr:hypothetical protein [Myxococcales bacterium]
MLAAFALLGCAPAGNLRPMLPMLPDRHLEFGTAWTAVGPRPVGHDDWAQGAQAWATGQPVTWFDVSVVGAFDGTHGTAGLAMRYRALETDRVGLGLGLEVGTGWAGLNLPVAVRVFDGVWMYSSPQLGTWGKDETVRLPIGLNVEVIDAVQLRTEAEMNYPAFDPYQRRLHLGVGVAYQL